MRKHLRSSTTLLLLLITLLGAFLRTYHFREYLLFDADQSRDAYFAKDVLDHGLGYLPLFGAKAGDRIELESDKSSDTDNKTVRLGPAYYYMQLVPAWIGQKADPVLLALPDLLLSIAAVPLLYFLLRQYFSKGISLWGTALFAASFFMVQYSRFAWNTNSVIFWEILLAIALLRTVKEDNQKKAGRWLVGVFLAYGILSQLHMIALLSFPVVVGLFWLFYRPTKVAWKYWAFGIAGLVLLYLPVIAAEVKNDGDNARRFFTQFQVEDERVQEDNQHKHGPIAYSLIQAGKIYIFSLTSLSQGEVGDVAEYTGIIFISGSLLLLVYGLARKHHAHHWIPKRHPLPALALIWFLVLALVYLQIAYRLDKPRYWLVGGALPFLFLAFWLAALKKMLTPRKFSLVLAAAMVLVIAFQLTALMNFFRSLDKGQESRFAHRNVPLNVHGNLAMLGQMHRSAVYMAKIAMQSNKAVCFYHDEYQQRDSYEYLLSYYYPQLTGKRISLDDDSAQNCEFFLLYLGEVDEQAKIKLAKRLRAKFNVLDMRKDRITTVLHVELTEKNNRTKTARSESASAIPRKAAYFRDLWQ